MWNNKMLQVNIRCGFIKAVLTISIFSFYINNATAAFFDIPAVGARAAATAGAMTALANDPLSALFYNPAGLSDIHSNTLLVGLIGSYFPVQYKSPGGYNEKNKFIGFSPYFAVNSNRFAPVSCGIGMYGTLGIGFEYDKDELHGVAHPFTSDTGNMYLSPTISLKINEKLNLGIGLNITYCQVKMGMPLPSGDLFDIDANGFCYGVNVGLLYKPIEKLNLGLRWRSPMKAKIKGDARYSIENDSITGHLYWPHIITFGTGLQISTRFIVLCDLEWIDYSYFSRKSHFTYSRLTFLNGPFFEGMEDAKRLHLGCEYIYSEKIVLRFGYMYNPRCLDKKYSSPLAPGNTFHTLHIGTGFKTDKFNFNIAILRNITPTVRVSESETGWPGQYKTTCWGLDLSAAYIF